MGETRKYVGARYVPVFADPLEWDADLKYEPLTIVTDENGVFYVSKQYVPEGITVDTTEYWIPWADWGDEISALDTRIDAIEDALPLSSFDDVNTVDARFDAIEDALPLSSFDDVNTVDARFDAIEDALPLSSFDDVNTVDKRFDTVEKFTYHEWGYETVSSLSAGETRDVQVTFTNTFPTVPGVIACIGNTSSSGSSLLDVTVQVTSRSTTGCTLRVYKTASGSVTIVWLAIAL